MRKILICGFLLCLVNFPAYPDTFHISIFNDYNLSALVISPDSGDFRLLADGREISVAAENDIVYISMTGDRLSLRNNSGVLGSFTLISFDAVEDEGGFTIRPVDPSLEMDYFKGSLELSIEFGRIKAVNLVSEDHYLTAVVEAEAGLGYHSMFYRAQAIISRTYLFGNLYRHTDEGFHLCDGVHCQVYKGRLTGNRTIYDAVHSTHGKVLIYGDTTLITAAFHSNCGGQTVNSEEVWLVYRPYLRTVTDPFCANGRSASWQRRIDSGAWYSYLSGLGMDNGGITPESGIFRFRQPRRAVLYSAGRFNVPLRKIRSDWNFRSTFLEVEVLDHGRSILVRGRGFGHGVGLCQEGAMEMAKRGHGYEEILKFYYTGISISDISELY